MPRSSFDRTYLVKDLTDHTEREVVGFHNLMAEYLPGRIIKAWPSGTMHQAYLPSTMSQRLSRVGKLTHALSFNNHELRIIRTR